MVHRVLSGRRNSAWVGDHSRVRDDFAIGAI